LIANPGAYSDLLFETTFLLGFVKGTDHWSGIKRRKGITSDSYGLLGCNFRREMFLPAIYLRLCMENRVPLPTDNIFKFYALFGLVLFIFSFASTLYNTKTTNEFMSSAIVELEELKAMAAPTNRDIARREILVRQIEVAKLDKNFYKWACAAIGAIGTLGMVVGFMKWHREIQPMLDEISQLQLAKLRHEVSQFNGNSTKVRRMFPHHSRRE